MLSFLWIGGAAKIHTPKFGISLPLELLLPVSFSFTFSCFGIWEKGQRGVGEP